MEVVQEQVQRDAEMKPFDDALRGVEFPEVRDPGLSFAPAVRVVQGDPIRKLRDEKELAESHKTLLLEGVLSKMDTRTRMLAL